MVATFDRILVPLDGSLVAAGVLPHVEAIATALNSEVILLQTTPSGAQLLVGAADSGIDEQGEATLEQERDELPAYSHAYLEVVAQRLRARSIPVTTEVADGTPAHVILDVADRFGVSVIVMSTHGRSGLSRVVFGSVAETVVRNSRLPVLLVRPQPEAETSSEGAA